MSATTKWLVGSLLVAGVVTFALRSRLFPARPGDVVASAPGLATAGRPGQLAAAAKVKPPRPPRGKWLAILFSGNGVGEIEPCG